MTNRCRVITVMLGALALLGSGVGRGIAGEAPDIDAQVRVREYVLINHDFNSDVDDPSNYAVMRSRFGVSFLAGKYSSAYLQFQDTRALGEPATTTTSLEQTDLHQGYVHVRNAFGGNLDLQIGRMEMSYGAERQIGTLDWSDVGRSFDGIRLSNLIEDFGWFDAFAMKLNETDGIGPIDAGAGVVDNPNTERSLVGGYLHYDANENTQVEAYLLDVHVDQGDLTDAGSGDTEKATGNLFTAGGRVVLELPETDFELYGEGAIQFGSAPPTAFGEDGADYQGFAAVLGAEYGMPTEVDSWLGFEMNWASGDDGTDPSTVDTYQQLFPTGHAVLGYMDLVGWQNIRDYQGTVGFAPSDPWELWGSYHYFQVDEPADSAYLANGQPWLSGDPEFDRALGSEIDLVARFRPEENLSFLAKFGLWMPGKYQKQSMGGSVSTPMELDSAVTLYLQTTATF